MFVKVADILLAAELENEMAEMAEGEGDDEQDYEDEMADVCFLFFCNSYCYCYCYFMLFGYRQPKCRFIS